MSRHFFTLTVKAFPIINMMNLLFIIILIKKTFTLC